MSGSLRIRHMSVIGVLAILCAVMLGCTASTADSGDAMHSATVQALLPTSEPTEPPPAATAEAPVARADTPAPATNTPAPPTYTPIPPPTYTPRPAPAPAGEAERGEAIRFQGETLDGSVINLSDTYGTPTLLAFWAPW